MTEADRFVSKYGNLVHSNEAEPDFIKTMLISMERARLQEDQIGENCFINNIQS